jgi:hypothetical protein
MFGQWCLGAQPLGEPEEFATIAPVPAQAFVWFTIVEATISLVETSTNLEVA